MEFYNPSTTSGPSFYTIDRFKWWRLPKDDSGESALVISVSATEAQLWTVAYTILVTLIFMAACEAATAAVVTFFRLGDSGTRHAILVTYYNAGRPSVSAPLMLVYLKNAFFRCRRNGKWAVDWSTVGASLGLFALALTLLSADLLTKFFLGGRKLIEARVAPVNPDAIFLPIFSSQVSVLDGSIPDEARKAYNALVSNAIKQAIARKTNAAGHIEQYGRITYSQNKIPSGALLPDGSLLNGTGATFHYSYNITGFEMGLRDAAELVFAVNGSCATAHGPRSVLYRTVEVPQAGNESGTSLEPFDYYPFFGNANYSGQLPLAREAYTPPWAYFNTYDNAEWVLQSQLNRGWAFTIVPHTAWRQSLTINSDDPWYETEDNPAYQPDTIDYFPYRVKRGRPQLECTQNDTYTYKGQTVTSVWDLGDLEGLKISPFLQYMVLLGEFGGVPALNRILAQLPVGSLDSATHFEPNKRELDVTRSSIFSDFEALVSTSFVYSREVVRNTVLLYSLLDASKDSQFYNAAKLDEAGIENWFSETPDPGLILAALNRTHVPAEYGEFFIDSTEVVAMSVLVVVATPVICLTLWLFVLLWYMILSPHSKLGNDGTRAKSRHGLRLHAFRATQLYRFLDEEISRSRRWSGRNTATPYIRDLDAVYDKSATAPAPGIAPVNLPASKEVGSGEDLEIGTTRPPTPDIRDLDDSIYDEKATPPASITPTNLPSGVGSMKTPEPNVKRIETERTSVFAKPQLLRFGPLPEPKPNFFAKTFNSVKGIFSKPKEPDVQPVQAAEPVVEGLYEIAITNAWDPNVKEVPWRNICRHPSEA